MKGANDSNEARVLKVCKKNCLISSFIGYFRLSSCTHLSSPHSLCAHTVINPHSKTPRVLLSPSQLPHSQLSPLISHFTSHQPLIYLVSPLLTFPLSSHLILLTSHLTASSSLAYLTSCPLRSPQTIHLSPPSTHIYQPIPTPTTTPRSLPPTSHHNLRLAAQ